jgi:hypothetical protein
MKLRLTVLAIAGLAAAGLVTAFRLHGSGVAPPRLGPDVEAICLDTMRRSGPHRTLVAAHRKRPPYDPVSVTLGELRLHDREFVRVAGFLHAEFEWVARYSSRGAMEFEWVALYSSRAAMDDPSRATWVNLQGLADDQHTLWTTLSDRCVVVEATYLKGAGGHIGVFNGTLNEVVKLEVWLTPYRPMARPEPPPPPPLRAPTSQRKPLPRH